MQTSTMRTNVAYDLSIYENEPVVEKVKSKAPKQAVGIGFSPKMVFFALVITAIGAAFLYANAMLNEVFADIRSVESEISVLEAEKTRLEMEIEGRLSLRNVEDYAKNQIGMNKIEKYQTEYVEITMGNTVELLGADGGTGSKEASRNPIAGIYAAVMEYFHNN